MYQSTDDTATYLNTTKKGLFEHTDKQLTGLHLFRASFRIHPSQKNNSRKNTWYEKLVLESLFENACLEGWVCI